MLEIQDLYVEVAGKEILKGVSLTIAPGEIHVLMGPNGVGKSTLAKVLGGDPQYVVTRGTIRFEGKELAALAPEERAHLGLFWSFQDPLEIPGLLTRPFLKSACNAHRAAAALPPYDDEAFTALLQSKAALLEIAPSRLDRSLNVGFSGGEKKKNETLQLLLFQPKLALLDEIDSGLDVDALKVVCTALLKEKQPHQSYFFITHYTRMLQWIRPDRVHILVDGALALSGDVELAHDIEKRGYDALCARY